MDNLPTEVVALVDELDRVCSVLRRLRDEIVPLQNSSYKTMMVQSLERAIDTADGSRASLNSAHRMACRFVEQSDGQR